MRSDDYSWVHEHLTPADAERKIAELTAPKLAFSAYSEMVQRKHRAEYIADGVLAAGQLAVIGGPVKSYKTSVAADLAISIGSGTPFLGKFTTSRRKVVMFSGESGPEAMEDLFHRIGVAKGIGDADVRVSYELPDLSGSTKSLSQHLCGAGVVVLDPLYLCFGSNAKPSDVFWMGSKFNDFCKVCSDAGATPIIVAHTVKAERRGPARLQNLAWSGIAERVRQWLLLRQRKPYNEGKQQLRLSVGGSLGHSGEWDIDIDDGTIPQRRWLVDVREPGAAPLPAALSADEMLVKDYLLLQGGEASVSSMETACAGQLTKNKVRKAIAVLEKRGLLEQKRITVAIGSGATRMVAGVALTGKL